MGVSGNISGAKEEEGLTACTVREGEESLEEVTADGAKDILRGPDICGGTGSMSQDGTTGADVGEPDKGETPGGVEAFVRDTEVPTFDAERDDAHRGRETKESLTGEVIPGRGAAG